MILRYVDLQYVDSIHVVDEDMARITNRYLSLLEGVTRNSKPLPARLSIASYAAVGSTVLEGIYVNIRLYMCW